MAVVCTSMSTTLTLHVSSSYNGSMVPLREHIHIQHTEPSKIYMIAGKPIKKKKKNPVHIWVCGNETTTTLFTQSTECDVYFASGDKYAQALVKHWRTKEGERREVKGGGCVSNVYGRIKKSSILFFVDFSLYSVFPIHFVSPECIAYRRTAFQEESVQRVAQIASSYFTRLF